MALSAVYAMWQVTRRAPGTLSEFTAWQWHQVQMPDLISPDVLQDLASFSPGSRSLRDQATCEDGLVPASENQDLGA